MATLPLTSQSLDLRREAIDLETRTGTTPARDILRAGVEGAEVVNKVLDNADNRAKAKQFEAVLQGGQTSMAEAVKQAKLEGFDVTRSEQSMALSTTAETQESWWKIFISSVDRQKLGETLETEGAAAGGRFATKTGLQTPEKGIEQQQKAETLDAVEALLKGDETTSEVKFDSDSTLKERKNELQKERRKFSGSKLSAEPQVKEKLKAVDKEISDIETVQKERRLTSQFFTREKNKKIDQTVRDLENETRVGLGIQFIDAAIPGGIFQAADKIAGVGGGSKLWREWLKTPEAIKINSAVKNYLGAVRKRDAGVAVTEREAKFLETQFGLNLRGTVADFIEAFKIKSVEATANLEKAWGRFTPAEQEEIRRSRPGLIFPSDIPGKGRRGGKIDTEDMSQKKTEGKVQPTAEEVDAMTEEQIDALEKELGIKK